MTNAGGWVLAEMGEGGRAVAHAHDLVAGVFR